MRTYDKKLRNSLQITGFGLMSLIGLGLVLFAFWDLNSNINDDLTEFISRVGGIDYGQVDYATEFIGNYVRDLLIYATLGTGLLLVGIGGVLKQFPKK